MIPLFELKYDRRKINMLSLLLTAWMIKLSDEATWTRTMNRPIKSWLLYHWVIAPTEITTILSMMNDQNIIVVSFIRWHYPKDKL